MSGHGPTAGIAPRSSRGATPRRHCAATQTVAMQSPAEESDIMGEARGRHYGMDWLRIGAFQLLILYHVGMAFVPWDFQVKDADPPIAWATILMLLTNPWRLSLLFAVSGYASAALFARQEG